MRKTKVGNIDIIIDPEESDHILFMDDKKAFVKYDIHKELIIDPEPEMVIMDNKKMRRTQSIWHTFDGNSYGSISIKITDTLKELPEVEQKSIIKEPGRARKIYNKLKRLING